MSRHRTSAAALSAASLFLIAPFAAQAACIGYATSAPDTPVPVGAGRIEEGSVVTDMAHDARLSVARSTRSSAAAIAPAWSESGPNAVIVVPASVSGPEPVCASLPFSAPMAAQSMHLTRAQLDQTQAHIAQLRQLRAQRQQTNGMSLHAQAGEQSRTESGTAAFNTPASLRSERVDLTVGADYRVNDQWAWGGSLGAGNVGMRWRGDSSRVDGQSGNLTGYAAFSPNESSFISAAYSLESTHYAVAPQDDGYTYRTTGINQGLSLSAGYDIQQGNWTLSPYLRGDAIVSRLGSFGAASGRTKGHSESVSAGAQVQTNVPTSWGLFAPHGRIEMTRITGWHLEGDSAVAYTASGAGLPSPTPLELDRQFGLVGIGASAVLQRGLSLFTDYDSNFAQRAVRSWRLTFGLRSEL